ncbi:MAG: asparagine synthase (glutamine-hydrolyzing) [Planctomycetota bacterium]|nr:asparagine synthase (glutamine-hydrolyzing) [Planctomycetota bacterium]MDA1165210.1 asparagine synthase (glutamine-hydrolyzing) [Planctomycetota bacterium]
MCGFTGLSLAEPFPWAENALHHMTGAIAHRGPDSDGFHIDTRRTSLLGFRRLAIRDLDPRANQPMQTASRRTAIAFNGEIYNSRQIAGQHCSQLTLNTSGDTEVLAESFEAIGEDIFPQCNGMFAAAFLDRDSGTITLTRDRVGKKPLYLYEGDGFVAFASELRCFEPFRLEWDAETLPSFFQFGHYPAPLTAFRRTTQLRPGESVTLRAGRVTGRRIWHDFTALAWGTQTTVDLDELDRTLSDAVAIRTLSDVPVGAFLSGGIDSSLVAAQLKASGHDTVPTFTVAFDTQSHNEAPFAAEIASYLGLEQIEIRIDPASLPELVSDFVDCYEQPYIDSSGLPSMALCREVRKYVTVALSGDGGDEFFGGYQRYDWFQKALQAQRFPATFRRLVGAALPLIDRRRGPRLQQLLAAGDAAGLYAQLMRAWPLGSSQEILSGVTADDAASQQQFRDIFDRLSCDPISKAQCADAMLYIPGDLQVKMDRASMRHSLEVRSPLLDSRMTEFGATLSTSVRTQHGLKSVLKSLLERHIPRKLFDRPKKGFSVPMRQWIAGPLKELVHETLAQQELRECGWLNRRYVDRLLRDFESGKPEVRDPLWMLLVLGQSFLRHRQRSAECDFRPEHLDSSPQRTAPSPRLEGAL